MLPSFLLTERQIHDSGFTPGVDLGITVDEPIEIILGVTHARSSKVWTLRFGVQKTVRLGASVPYWLSRRNIIAGLTKWLCIQVGSGSGSCRHAGTSHVGATD